jgi:hypothetical protein
MSACHPTTRKKEVAYGHQNFGSPIPSFYYWGDDDDHHHEDECSVARRDVLELRSFVGCLNPYVFLCYIGDFSKSLSVNP